MGQDDFFLAVTVKVTGGRYRWKNRFANSCGNGRCMEIIPAIYISEHLRGLALSDNQDVHPQVTV